jgi:hypothetical protein
VAAAEAAQAAIADLEHVKVRITPVRRSNAWDGTAHLGGAAARHPVTVADGLT